METERFFLWLRHDYGLKTDKSANTYVRRAHAVEAAEGIDLDAEARNDGLLRLVSRTENRGDLEPAVRRDYIVALKRYAEFRRAN
jgi:hypothetical protein